jgi:hypothetical protein
MAIFICLLCLLGMVAIRFRGPAQVAPADLAARDDVPVRLLRWAVSLLSAQREEWGQAMLGELGSVDGRARRWRFAAGCVSAALLLPPWGRAAAAVWAMVAVAAGSVGLYAFVGVRYGLLAWDWVFSAVALVILVSYTLAASVLLRSPRVALPGLLGGLLAALIWLAPGYTFYDVITSMNPLWVGLVQVIVVPLLVGVVGALWGGSAAAGRRIARLAAFSAALYVFLYGTLAVAAMGLGGPPGDPGCTGICNIGDRLGNNAIFNLWCLPLWTAALGWAAAAYTARIRSLPATAVVPVPFTAAGGVHEERRDPVPVPEMTVPEVAVPEVAVPEETGRPARVRSRRRTAGRVLLWFIVAIIVVLIFAAWLWAPSRG